MDQSIDKTLGEFLSQECDQKFRGFGFGERQHVRTGLDAGFEHEPRLARFFGRKSGVTDRAFGLSCKFAFGFAERNMFRSLERRGLGTNPGAPSFERPC